MKRALVAAVAALTLSTAAVGQPLKEWEVVMDQPTKVEVNTREFEYSKNRDGDPSYVAHVRITQVYKQPMRMVLVSTVSDCKKKRGTLWMLSYTNPDAVLDKPYDFSSGPKNMTDLYGQIVCEIATSFHQK